MNIEHDGQRSRNRQSGSRIKNKLNGGKFVLSNGILTERVHVKKDVGNHCVSSEDHIVV